MLGLVFVSVSTTIRPPLLSVKGPPSFGTPVSIRFRSDDAIIPTFDPSVKVADVPGSDVLTDLFKRLTDCYALPLTQRVRTARVPQQWGHGGSVGFERRGLHELVPRRCHGAAMGSGQCGVLPRQWC